MCTLTKPLYWICLLFPGWKPKDNRHLRLRFLTLQCSCCYTRGNGTYLLTSRCSHGNTSKELKDWQKPERRREEKQAWDTLLLYRCTLDCLSVAFLGSVTRLFPLLSEAKTKVEHSMKTLLKSTAPWLVSLRLNTFVGFRVCLYIFQGFVGVHCPMWSTPRVMKTRLTHQRSLRPEKFWNKI